MSGISISPYFPFRRIKITKQAVDPSATKAVICLKRQFMIARS
jgi:hypothetical protein